MPWTINRIDNGEPACDQHGDPTEQTAKKWDTPQAAQAVADGENFHGKRWEVKEARDFVVLIGLSSKRVTCKAEAARYLSNLVKAARAGKVVPGLMLPRGEQP